MPASSFTLVATGDAVVAAPGESLTEIDTADQFQTLVRIIENADAAVTQLEPVLIEDGCRHDSLRQIRDQYQYLAPFPGAIMGTDPAVLDLLEAMGLNLFTVASNHSLDFGQDGLQTTRNALERRDLTFAGCGETLSEAREPSVLETDAGSVALLDATTSVPPGGEAGISTGFPATPGVNPLHIEWLYRVRTRQLDQLRAVAQQTGIEQIKGEWLRRENDDWETDSPYYFMHMPFAPATETSPPGIYQSINERDRTAVLDQIRQASEQTDWVVMAIHSHQSAEGNRNTATPPAFLETFARECIDCGSHAVVVTGPHTLRGIECYRERPICYSLGNFFFQEETIYRVPDTVGADADPDVPDVRGEAGREADPANTTSSDSHDTDNWRSVVPECVFDADGTLDSLLLYPCTLGPDGDDTERGVPELATGQQARSILQTVARRSEPFGTTVQIEDGIGRIRP